MDDAGARAMQHLIGLINGRTYVAGFRQGSFLVPLHAQSTDMAPAKTLYEHVINSDAQDGYCEMALGFSAADVPNCGPSVLGYAATREEAEAKAGGLASKLTAARATFDTTLYSPAEAIGRALASPGRTILADVQDNPGAGGSSDTTGLLGALVAAGARKALLGLICDPAVARQAHQAGVGAKITCGVGGASDKAPFDGTFEVLSLSDCPIRYTGKMYGGGYASLGPSCLLWCQDGGADVQIVVTSQRIQCLDQALFRHFGAVPEEAKLICVKSTVHFRDDFHALADEILNVAAPGAFSCKLDDVQYKHLRKGVDVVI
jgi:microcystin degradation protein MlrC